MEPAGDGCIGRLFDKNWTVCDNTPSSPYYGRCYTQWGGSGGVRLSVSLDGGLTWGAPTGPLTPTYGFGGQPVAQPNGTVIVPFAGGPGIGAFRSTDGGATWSSTVFVASVIQHRVGGDLRVLLAPSAEIDAAGTVYVAWHDCRFRAGCAANDIVISASADGLIWSPPQRVPIDALDSTADHFIVGLGVDRTTSGASAHLGLVFYYYPVAGCLLATCQLSAGFISSIDGGATWSTSAHLGGPMCLSWLPQTSQGRMVGDYLSTSFANGRAYPVFALAHARAGDIFDQAIFSMADGIDPLAPPAAPLILAPEPALCPVIFLPWLAVA